ncbi:enoyl-CoA delta isomerase 2-like [Oratosquilla oratoria]|uniref:enoyl-CoA delta isomerase 2-like n=1 Tax=Oratosquilla oratoria TaxID=337810 RepID=UPI003F7722FF
MGDLQVTDKNGVRIVRFNNPDRKNALNVEMFMGIAPTLLKAADDPDVKIVVFTGTGDYFTSGNDLSNFTKNSSGGETGVGGSTDGEPPDMDSLVQRAGDKFRNLVKVVIDFPKPLVAVVNGPAIGIGVTILALFDIVYASEKATFQTPFMSIGQSPEGCSTYLFPRIMGPTKAAEVLLFEKKLSAREAQQAGLVTEVYHDEDVEDIWSRILGWTKYPMNGLIYAKELMRNANREVLHKVNDAECDRLMERWTSEDFFEAMMKFFKRKSKL